MIDAYVEELKLGKLGLDGVRPECTGRRSYHPSTLLKIYIYGYLNRIRAAVSKWHSVRVKLSPNYLMLQLPSPIVLMEWRHLRHLKAQSPGTSLR